MPYNVLGAGSASGYEIEQSLRFNDDDSAYLSRTPASAGNRKTWTWSGWFKRGNLNSVRRAIFGSIPTSGNTNSNTIQFGFLSDDKFQLGLQTAYVFNSNQVFRDVGAWYHIIVSVDTTQASANDRIKVYINSDQITSWSLDQISLLVPQNGDLGVNQTDIHEIGSFLSSNYFDGYIAEVNFIDGQALTPADFGETDLLTNQWIPKKYVGTYGTNGFYLDFGNSGSLGADSSGNGNNWTPNNLTATDQVLDSPTNNFATLNPLSKLNWLSQNSTVTTSNGNLGFAVGVGGNMMDTTIAVSSGKWYWEVTQSNYIINGIRSTRGIPTGDFTYRYYQNNGQIIYIPYNTTSQTVLTTVATATSGDIIGIALDLDNRTISWYKNNSLLYTATSIVADEYAPCVGGAANSNSSVINFGQDSSFAGNKTAQGNTDDNGIGDFYYTPPSGYLALCEDNLPDPSIALPGDHFNTVLYTGNGSTQSITGVGFQPNLNWIKARNSPEYNVLHDVLRGANNRLFSNTTDAETTAPTMTSFDSDGFSVSTDGGTYSATNANGTTYAAWNWKANGSGVTNTDGSTTSTVSANTTAGFSIVTCTTLAGTQTVGHGLSQAPDIVIQKSRNTAQSWYVYYDFVDGSQDYLTLNSTAAAAAWGGSAATSTVFYENWSAGVNLICYCFHSVEGYSKIGSYTGNGSVDGPFVYTGFKPDFVIIKRTNVSGDSWFMFDTARDTFNPLDSWLGANLSNTEGSNTFADSLSNGFKLRGSISAFNGSGSTYIYMAFAETPFKYSLGR